MAYSCKAENKDKENTSLYNALSEKTKKNLNGQNNLQFLWKDLKLLTSYL